MACAGFVHESLPDCQRNTMHRDWLKNNRYPAASYLEASEAEAILTVPDAQNHWRPGTEGLFDPQPPKTVVWRRRAMVHPTAPGASFYLILAHSPRG